MAACRVLIHDLHPVAGTASTQLINEIPEDLIAYADASLLRRVFQNLVANAIKYTPRGEVVIGARETGAEGAIECWVSDNGAGIPEDRLEIIFDKLETDPEKRGWNRPGSRHREDVCRGSRREGDRRKQGRRLAQPSGSRFPAARRFANQAELSFRGSPNSLERPCSDNGDAGFFRKRKRHASGHPLCSVPSDRRTTN